MGCIQSPANNGAQEDFAAKNQSEAINSKIRQDKLTIENLITILLLGAGDTGKSTVMKQMKIIHKEGFSIDERLVYKDIIFDNIVLIAKSLLQGCIKLKLDIKQENRTIAQEITSFEKDDENNFDAHHILRIVKTLWQDPAIQTAYTKNNQFQLIDSAAYYLNALDRILASDYIPSESDVLHTRVTTTGIVETAFEYKKLNFKMIDVGGQRNERKKWIHCFENVTAVIFCVSLAEYDLKLFEDENKNRMHESLGLFDQIINCRWFQDTPIILFLNKLDLFEEKVVRVDLKQFFSEYNGGPNKDAAIQFIKKLFESKNSQSTNRKKFIHTLRQPLIQII